MSLYFFLLLHLHCIFKRKKEAIPEKPIEGFLGFLFGANPVGRRPDLLYGFGVFLWMFGFIMLKRAHLLGFSDGANIALAFAMKYPERVNNLILNGGNLVPWGVKFFVQLPVVLGYWLAKGISVFDKKAVAKAELLGLMVTQPNLTPADLADLSVPTLVIAGTNDMIRTSHTRKIHAAIAGSKLALIDGDHFVAHGNPDAFNAAVLEFLRG